MADYRFPRRAYYHPYDPYGHHARRMPTRAAHDRPTGEEAAADPPNTPAPVPRAESQGREALEARVAELEAQLAAEREQAADQRTRADSYLDLAQRTQADFLNYKRRAERERGEEGEVARAELLRQLLPVLDDLERALAHVPEDLREHQWAAGLPLIARQLRLALARAGVQRLGEPGETFDPRFHEAVAHEPHSSLPEGAIVTVVQPGYRLGERLVRPARVTVAQREGAAR